jgi:hypothetical protein
MESSSTVPYCVVELNCYYGLDGTVFVKELAVAARDQYWPKQWVFRAPSSLDEAETKELNSKVFLQCGIKLEDGDLAYECMPEILKKAVRDFSEVFVCGNRCFKKENFISKIIGREVTDITELFTPMIKDEKTWKNSDINCYPQPASGFPKCVYHRINQYPGKSKLSSKCAVLKCSKTAFRLMKHRHNPKYHTAYVPKYNINYDLSTLLGKQQAYANFLNASVWRFISSLGKPQSVKCCHLMTRR